MLLFVIFFILLSVLHLYGCYFHKDKLRKLTKPLLLLSLAVFYGVNAKPVNYFVLAALVCGMLGDILLIWANDLKCFLTGACIFSLGHVFYAYVLFTSAQLNSLGSSLWIMAAVAAAYIIAVALAGKKITPHISLGFMKLLTPAYLALVAIMNLGAWLALICAVKSGGNAFGASLTVLGAMFFLASDTILSLGVFRGEKPRTNFYVMLTYIAAQFSLCMGFLRYL